MDVLKRYEMEYGFELTDREKFLLQQGFQWGKESEVKKYTIGEVFDSLKPGQLAISTDDSDQDTIISIDDNNRYYIIYANSNYKTHDINLIHSNEVKNIKHWEIFNIDKPTQRMLDSFEWDEE